MRSNYSCSNVNLSYFRAKNTPEKNYVCSTLHFYLDAPLLNRNTATVKQSRKLKKKLNCHDKFSAQHKYVQPISLKFSTCIIVYFVHVLICLYIRVPRVGVNNQLHWQFYNTSLVSSNLPLFFSNAKNRKV